MKKNPKNVLYLYLDAFRFDLLQNERDARILLPNIMSLVDKGYLRRIVSNGMITKVTLPTLLTLTYPLDHEGYNNVIGTRPRSFVEILKEYGYDTKMVASHFFSGPTGNVERGFDTFTPLVDHRSILEMYLRHVFLYHVGRWENGELGDDEIFAMLRGEYDEVLQYAINSHDRTDVTYVPRAFRKLTPRWVSRYQAERDLVRDEPMAVLKKMQSIQPIIFQYYLGKKNFNGLGLKIRNLHRTLGLYSNRLAQIALTKSITIYLGFKRIHTNEVMRLGLSFFEDLKDPWFVILHLMDAHDFKHFNRPLKSLIRLRFLPRVWRITRRGKAAREATYDAAASYMDHHIGKLIRKLENDGRMENTLVVVMGDHGHSWDPARDQGLARELGFRTHYEHIDVPFIMTGGQGAPSDEGVHDTMSMSRTLLEELDLPMHESFLGRSLYEPGKRAAIVESVGRGNTDVDRRDIYFTITSRTHKLMTMLSGRIFAIERLYDIAKDPQELNNLVGIQGFDGVIEDFYDFLFEERQELLDRRNAIHPYHGDSV